METIDRIVSQFIEEQKPHIKDNILVVIAHGSRILKTNRPDSDLDLFIIADCQRNYRLGSIIDGIKVDCNVYSSKSIFDIISSTIYDNNTYFKTVLSNGYIIKDENHFVIELIEYIEEISDIKLPKREIPISSLSELYYLYNTYISNPNDYNYYNLLEKIRNIYHYKNRYSFISIVKVLPIYSNIDEYVTNYNLVLPPKTFTTTFQEALSTTDNESRKSIIESLIEQLKLPKKIEIPEYYDQDVFLTNDEIRYKLSVLHNRLTSLQRLVMNNDPSTPYIFNITLYQIISLSKNLNTYNSIIDTIELLDSENNPLFKMKLLWHIFTITGTDYHFDYDNYMLKLR